MVSNEEVFRNSTLNEIIDDLCVRFIINLPPEEQDSVERVFFQVEEAHWFYDDFIRKCNPNLPNLTLRAFSSKVFMQCPMIKRWELDASEAFAEFIKYKGIVPVRGAIMLNDRLDSCVLVKSLKGSSLSFPRGKINRGESDVDCAVREVYEETGCDLAGRIRPEDVLEGTSPGTQNIKLYIVPGVSMDTLFETKTRGEISDIKWMRLSEIPTAAAKRYGNDTPQAPGQGRSKFFMVSPFVGRLKKWIATKGKQWQRERSQNLAAAPVEYTSEPAQYNEVENRMEEPQQQSNLQQEQHQERYDVDEQPQSGFFSAAEPQSESVEDSSAALRSLLGIHAGQGQQSDEGQNHTQSLLGQFFGQQPQSQPPQHQPQQQNYLQQSPNRNLLNTLLQSQQDTQPQSSSTQYDPSRQLHEMLMSGLNNTHQQQQQQHQQHQQHQQQQHPQPFAGQIPQHLGQQLGQQSQLPRQEPSQLLHQEGANLDKSFQLLSLFKNTKVESPTAPTSIPVQAQQGRAPERSSPFSSGQQHARQGSLLGQQQRQSPLLSTSHQSGTSSYYMNQAAQGSAGSLLHSNNVAGRPSTLPRTPDYMSSPALGPPKPLTPQTLGLLHTLKSGSHPPGSSPTSSQVRPEQQGLPSSASSYQTTFPPGPPSAGLSNPHSSSLLSALRSGAPSTKSVQNVQQPPQYTGMGFIPQQGSPVSVGSNGVHRGYIPQQPTPPSGSGAGISESHKAQLLAALRSKSPLSKPPLTNADLPFNTFQTPSPQRNTTLQSSTSNAPKRISDPPNFFDTTFDKRQATSKDQTDTLLKLFKAPSSVENTSLLGRSNDGGVSISSGGVGLGNHTQQPSGQPSNGPNAYGFGGLIRSSTYSEALPHLAHQPPPAPQTVGPAGPSPFSSLALQNSLGSGGPLKRTNTMPTTGNVQAKKPTTTQDQGFLLGFLEKVAREGAQ